MPTDSRDNDADESQQYRLRQAESDKGRGAKSSNEGRRKISAPAVVRLILGALLVAAGLAFFGFIDSLGEMNLGEIVLFGLPGLALVTPGVVLVIGSLFVIKKTDKADSTKKKVAKGCVMTFLNLLTGLVLLLLLLIFVIPLLE